VRVDDLDPGGARMSGAGFYVRCQVSGGVTGLRVGFLKREGQTVRFETREEAQAAADEATAAVAGNTRAVFDYRVVEDA
jgi:hypothetical protein